MNYQDYQAQQAKLKSIADFEYPGLKDAQVAFSTLDTDERLLELAEEKGFDKGHTPYNDLFNELFYKGGKINFKSGLDAGRKERGWRYLKAYMTSFTPRHEHKEAVSALILSDLAEV